MVRDCDGIAVDVKIPAATRSRWIHRYEKGGVRCCLRMRRVYLGKSLREVIIHSCKAESAMGGHRETGATTVLLRFPPGLAVKVHSHPAANQHVYGIRGEIEGEDGARTIIEGIYAYFPKGEEHGGSRFTEESVLLFH